MTEKTYRLELTGARALLMANVALGDPEDPWAKQITKLNALKSKITAEQDADRNWLKFRGSLYYDKDLGPVLPSDNIRKSLRDCAGLTREGKDVERGVVMLDDLNALQYDGPRTPEALWGAGTEDVGATRFVDRRMGKINRAPVVAIRPKFEEWKVSTLIFLDESVLSSDDLRSFATKAGRLIHIGAYRQRYGAYTAELEEEK